jgi:bifunctional non-homologous end joining protein LigD
LVSRNRNAFETFPVLAEGIGSAIPHEAVLDGEIVYLGPDGFPRFYDLMRRRSPQHFYAFDLLWLDGRDLRALPLLKRKAMLRKLVRRPCCTSIMS